MEKVKKISPFRLSSLLRLQKDPKLALQLFLNPNPGQNDGPNAKPFRYSLLSYDLIIFKLGKAKMFSEMQKIIERLKDDKRVIPKEIIFCNVITFYGRARLPQKALQVFDEMPAFRCQRTIKSVNTLLNSLLVCGEFEKMREIFAGIEEYGKPDACTFNILINACCLRGDLESAWNVFDEMRKKDVEPNVVTFGTLINGLCLNMELSRAFRLKRKMEKEFKIKPNAAIYVALIKGLCKVDELNKAIELKEEMLRNRVELQPAVYSTLISALYKVGQKGEVPELLEEMKGNGCKPDTVTYNSMISGLCNENEFDSAFAVLNEMEKMGCKPDVVSYNVIISGLCREGKVREASELMQDMPGLKCFPDVVTYRTIFNGLCDVRQFSEAALILDEMVFKEYTPHPSSLKRLMDGLVQEGHIGMLWTVLKSSVKTNAINTEIWGFIISLVCEDDQLSNVWESVSGLITEDTISVR